MSEFKAYRIQERDGKVVAGFEQLTLDALTPGDVDEAMAEGDAGDEGGGSAESLEASGSSDDL